MTFNVIFSIQSLEFIKSLNLESNLKKKTEKKTLKLFIFHLKMFFYRLKMLFIFISNIIYSDRSKLDISDETIRIQNFYFGRKL